MTPKQARIQIGYFIDCLKRIDHKYSSIGLMLIIGRLSEIDNDSDSDQCHYVTQDAASDYRYTMERISYFGEIK